MKDIAMKRYIGTKIIQAEPSHSTSDNPAVGQPGYKVVYADGYTSWSPQGAFEEAYRPCDAMTFGLALEALKKGLKVQRGGWNGKGLWLELQVPDAHSKMTLPYIFMSYPSDAKTTPGARVPWLASQTDMLAEDWVIVD
jgi:hypothetical protein